MDYWLECVAIGIEEAGVTASAAQIEEIAESVRAGYDNYSMAHGHDAIGRVESEAERELSNIKREAEKKDMWINSTKPCTSCTTSGWVLDGWGRDAVCMNCNGNGRVRG